MEIIYAQEPINTNGKIIFLAGPTPRAIDVKSWRGEAITMFERLGFNGTLLIPEMRGGFNREFAYAEQIDWEQEGLEKADVILFWIPRNLKDMPAFTTNIEFGYWLAYEPSKIIMGFPTDAPKMNYIKYKCEELNIDISDTLIETIKNAIKDK